MSPRQILGDFFLSPKYNILDFWGILEYSFFLAV